MAYLAKNSLTTFCIPEINTIGCATYLHLVQNQHLCPPLQRISRYKQIIRTFVRCLIIFILNISTKAEKNYLNSSTSFGQVARTLCLHGATLIIIWTSVQVLKRFQHSPWASSSHIVVLAWGKYLLRTLS